MLSTEALVKRSFILHDFIENTNIAAMSTAKRRIMKEYMHKR